MKKFYTRRENFSLNNNNYNQNMNFSLYDSNCGNSLLNNFILQQPLNQNCGCETTTSYTKKCITNSQCQRGPRGYAGPQGETGPIGPQGETGPAGPQGEVGPAGEIANFADFYGIMPPDNADTIAPGSDVSFPQDGPTSASTITRSSDSSFSLSEIGTYLIFFQVNITEAGQLVLTINDEEIPYTVVGSATGTDQITGISIIQTTIATSILSVRNPTNNPAALTITPTAGGTQPVSAHLVIIQLQ